MKFQAWRTSVFPFGLTIDGTANGTVRVVLWSAMPGFDQEKAGSVTVFLRSYSEGEYAEIGQGSLTEQDWQGGCNTWVEKTVTITGVNYTIPPGGQLEVKVIVDDSAQQKVWFAYDTMAYDSRVELLIPTSTSTLTRMTPATGTPTPATTTRAPPSPTPMENPRFCIWFPHLCDWFCTRFPWLCD